MLVVNPAAGKRNGEKYLSSVCARLQQQGWIVTVFTTFGRGDGYGYVSEYGKDYDRVVAMGGDGTMNEVVSGVLGAGLDVPVGYVPAGSTNDFATTHGLPSDPEKAAEVAGGDSVKSIDTGTFADRFICNHGACGPLANVVNAAPQEVKNIMGYGAYILEGAKDVTTFKSVHVKFTLDTGEVLEGDFIYGAFLNTTYLGGGLANLPKEGFAVDDGRYELVLMKKPNDLYETGELFSDMLTLNFDDTYLFYRHVRRCTVEFAPDTQWSLDGETYVGGSRAEFRVLDNGLRLCKP